MIVRYIENYGQLNSILEKVGFVKIEEEIDHGTFESGKWISVNGILSVKNICHDNYGPDEKYNTLELKFDCQSEMKIANFETFWDKLVDTELEMSVS